MERRFIEPSNWGVRYFCAEKSTRRAAALKSELWTRFPLGWNWGISVLKIIRQTKGGLTTEITDSAWCNLRRCRKVEWAAIRDDKTVRIYDLTPGSNCYGSVTRKTELWDNHRQSLGIKENTIREKKPLWSTKSILTNFCGKKRLSTWGQNWKVLATRQFSTTRVLTWQLTFFLYYFGSNLLD